MLSLFIWIDWVTPPKSARLAQRKQAGSQQFIGSLFIRRFVKQLNKNSGFTEFPFMIF